MRRDATGRPADHSGLRLGRPVVAGVFRRRDGRAVLSSASSVAYGRRCRSSGRPAAAALRSFLPAASPTASRSVARSCRARLTSVVLLRLDRGVIRRRCVVELAFASCVRSASVAEGLLELLVRLSATRSLMALPTPRRQRRAIASSGRLYVCWYSAFVGQARSRRLTAAGDGECRDDGDEQDGDRAAHRVEASGTPPEWATEGWQSG